MTVTPSVSYREMILPMGFPGIGAGTEVWDRNACSSFRTIRATSAATEIGAVVWARGGGCKETEGAGDGCQRRTWIGARGRCCNASCLSILFSRSSIYLTSAKFSASNLAQRLIASWDTWDNADPTSLTTSPPPHDAATELQQLLDGTCCQLPMTAWWSRCRLTSHMSGSEFASGGAAPTETYVAPCLTLDGRIHLSELLLEVLITGGNLGTQLLSAI